MAQEPAAGDVQQIDAQRVDALLADLARSRFRRRFRLGPAELDYLASRGLEEVMRHARRFLTERLAPADPPNDGRQTPLAGHPVFTAQHATATCCRKCLAKWHRIEPAVELNARQIAGVLAVIEAWLRRQVPAHLAIDPPVGGAQFRQLDFFAAEEF